MNLQVEKVQNGYIVKVITQVATVYAGSIGGGYRTSEEIHIANTKEELIEKLKELIK